MKIYLETFEYENFLILFGVIRRYSFQKYWKGQKMRRFIYDLKEFYSDLYEFGEIISF